MYILSSIYVVYKVFYVRTHYCCNNIISLSVIIKVIHSVCLSTYLSTYQSITAPSVGCTSLHSPVCFSSAE